MFLPEDHTKYGAQDQAIHHLDLACFPIGQDHAKIKAIDRSTLRGTRSECVFVFRKGPRSEKDFA